jgi:hypothetical protein
MEIPDEAESSRGANLVASGEQIAGKPGRACSSRDPLDRRPTHPL